MVIVQFEVLGGRDGLVTSDVCSNHANNGPIDDVVWMRLSL